MRNDARPVGEHSPASPLGGEDAKRRPSAEDSARNQQRDRGGDADESSEAQREQRRDDERVRPAPGHYHPE